MIWLLILQSLYFFLPAYFANMAPELFKWVPAGAKPIHQKKFGDHKTWRGLVVAVVLGTIIFLIQQWLYQFDLFYEISLIDYNGFPFWFGSLLGLGAILGDLIKSYYKRKEGIKPGESWKPWDQLDFVIGGIIGSFFFYVPPASVVAILLIISPLLHITVNHIAYGLRIRKSKW